MHVAIAGSRGFPYVYSGYETFVSELAPRLVARGHRVTVYCHRGLFSERPTEVRGVQLVYAWGVRGRNLSQPTHSLSSAVHLVLRRDRPDVVLFVNSANGPLGFLLGAAGIPAAVNVDGLEWLRPKWRGLGAVYFRWASRMATRAYDLVITDAEAMAEAYRREFGAPSVTIAYGANLGWSTNAECLKLFGLERDGYYLVVGRLVPDNNADTVVRGFVGATSGRKLVVVGDVPYADGYAQAVRTAGDERVVFTGYVRDPDVLRELYCNAYAYLHGHEFGGTNPTLLKALACGCCIAALDTPFSREVLAAERHGVYFCKDPASVAQTIAMLDASPRLVRDMRARARGRIDEAYTWERITGQYEAALRRLCEGHDEP